MNFYSLGSAPYVDREVAALTCAPAVKPVKAWAYRKLKDGALVETATWAGDALPGLLAHFHGEAQCVFVLAGARTFRIRSAILSVQAGESLYIPSRVRTRRSKCPETAPPVSICILRPTPRLTR